MRMRPTTWRRGALGASLAVLSLASLAPPAAATRIYGGEHLSERLNLNLSVSDDGATLTGITLVSELRCGSYMRPDTGTTTSVDALPAQPEEGVLYLTGTSLSGGRIDATLLIARRRGTGRTDIARGRLTGSLTAGRGSGTLQLSSQIIEDAGGRVLRTCSRTLPWRAARNPGRLFAGATSQGAPVVLRVSADRRRITSTLVAWVAPCRVARYYFEPHDDFLLPFGVRRGGSFSQRYRYDAGGDAEAIGRFSGRLSGTTARGSFRTRVVGGGDRCNTGRRTWSATTG